MFPQSPTWAPVPTLRADPASMVTISTSAGHWKRTHRCSCAHTCKCMCTHICSCTHIHTHRLIDALHTHTYIHVHTHAYTPTCTPVCTQTNLLMHTQSCICAYTQGFPDGSVVRNPPANAADTGDTGSIPLVGKILWRRKLQPTPVFLPGESHGQRSMEGYSPWGTRVGHTHRHTPQSTASQSACHQRQPQEYLERQTLSPYPRPRESSTLRVGADNLCVTSYSPQGHKESNTSE